MSAETQLMATTMKAVEGVIVPPLRDAPPPKAPDITSPPVWAPNDHGEMKRVDPLMDGYVALSDFRNVCTALEETRGLLNDIRELTETARE